MSARLPPSELSLRAVLALVGLAVVFTGVNVGLGGILTLGLQGSRDFVTITDPARFLAQDSHVRFLGGVWLGVGLVFIAASVRLHAMKAPLYAALALVFLGGLARLSGGRLDVVLGPQIVGSFLAEIVLMPALWLWASRRPPVRTS